MHAQTVDDIIIMGDFNELNPKQDILPNIDAYRKHQIEGEQGENEFHTIPEAHTKADYILHIIPPNSKSVCKPFNVNIGYTIINSKGESTIQTHGSDHSQIYTKNLQLINQP